MHRLYGYRLSRIDNTVTVYIIGYGKSLYRLIGSVFIEKIPFFLVSPMDYDHVSNILEFARCDTRQCIQIPVVDNRTVELTESFFVTLERTSDMINLGPVSGMVEITDDDGMYIISCTWVL